MANLLGTVFTTAKEDLVGWPLSQHSLERVCQIWDRFKDQSDNPVLEDVR
jgi:hypothetical protein